MSEKGLTSKKKQFQIYMLKTDKILLSQLSIDVGELKKPGSGVKIPEGDIITEALALYKKHVDSHSEQNNKKEWFV